MNDNYGFDFNMNSYHINEDFTNYISKEFGNSNVLSDILSTNTPVTSSVTSSMTPTNISFSHCNPNLNLSSSLNSSSSSLPSSSSPSPASSSVASPSSSLNSSSLSCLSITSVIDFQKMKNEMAHNNNNKPKADGEKSNASHNAFALNCQSNLKQSTNAPLQHAQMTSPSLQNTSSIRNSREFSEEEKEQLQIAPFLSSVSENYCDITEYLTLPQNQAAKKLQMRPSTFSKRWKEASRNRKWPWRNVRKIDKEITCILHNMPKIGQLSEEVESHLTVLLKQRQEELKPVVIRIS